MSNIVFEAKNIEINFGGLKAVDDFNIQIEKGKLMGLIGPNGAGKTTVFNMITGVYQPTSGELILEGLNINKIKTSKRVTKGIARTFQNIRLFKSMSVLDNVKVAFHINSNYGFLSSIIRTRKYWKQEKEIEHKALSLLKIFDLDGFAHANSSSLPYGKQRKLEIARALAASPKLLCLDEPAAGMNPSETEELMETIKLIKEKFDTTILLIEHDMKLVMGICDEITVLSFGKVIATGKPLEIQKNEDVIKAYLGG